MRPACVALGLAFAAIMVLCAPARAEGPTLYDAWRAESATNGTEITEAAYARHIVRIIWAGAGLDPAGALNVARCESEFNPDDVGLAGERGIFQIHPVHRWRFAAHGWTWDDAFDPWVNAIVALDIYRDAGGWRPWSCKPGIVGGW